MTAELPRLPIELEPGVSKTCVGFKRESDNCCDTGQNDIIGKIELNPSFFLSSYNTNYKNDIQ